MPKQKRVIVRVALDEGRPVGNRSKFKVEYIKSAAIMAQNGMTDRAIAMALGVSYSNFRVWMGRHPKLREAIKIPKEVANDLVKLSLFQNARGYDYYEEEIKVLDGEIVKVKVLKHRPADTTAALAWLNNCLPEEFKRNPVPELIPPPPPEGMDITPSNKREIARRFAYVLMEYKQGKLN